jgi:hypothetical protein
MVFGMKIYFFKKQKKSFLIIYSRAYWNGKNFYSRQGNLFHAPDFFKAALPKVPLDGEIW